MAAGPSLAISAAVNTKSPGFLFDSTRGLSIVDLAAAMLRPCIGSRFLRNRLWQLLQPIERIAGELMKPDPEGEKRHIERKRQRTQ